MCVYVLCCINNRQDPTTVIVDVTQIVDDLPEIVAAAQHEVVGVGFETAALKLDIVKHCW
jgi:hypothetical protein